MTEVRSSTLQTADGLELALLDLGREDAAKALIVVHGYGEHGGRYVERARHFVEAGYRVLLPDVRGHGRSGGPRGYVMRFEQYLDDLDLVFAQCSSPAYLFGHSHGGLIAAAWMLAGRGSIERAALSSPFFGVGLTPPAWKVSAANLLSRLMPRVSLPTEIDPSVVSHDPAVVAAYKRDPLIHHVNNARWYTEAMSAIEGAFAAAPTLTVPTLVIQAGDDRLVSASESERWASLLPPEQSRFERVDGAFHELFFEPDGQRHAERVLRWLDEGR